VLRINEQESYTYFVDKSLLFSTVKELSKSVEVVVVVVTAKCC